MIDSKIMETTKSILKEFGNTYFSDKGTLKRNKVIEDLDTYTPMLMEALHLSLWCIMVLYKLKL
ncbi:hypothetical protein ACXDFG_10285 (plasmid) [Pediococcus pentosaceus]|jgi:adenine-specific DNA-methyltransferase